MSDHTAFLQQHARIAIISLEKVEGSAPREEGTWMLVATDSIYGTIGGGVLEWQAIANARDQLMSGTSDKKEYTLKLGPDSGQCCGGVVTYCCVTGASESIEAVIAAASESAAEWKSVYIFGAGHVGLALAKALLPLPFDIHLVDSRLDELGKAPPNIKTHHVAIEEEVVSSAKQGSLFVVMTHDHGRDFMITEVALNRSDARYVGLVGSQTKRARFENYFKSNGGDANTLANLTCPIGLSTNKSKRPEVIAALTAAELLNAAS